MNKKMKIVGVAPLIAIPTFLYLILTVVIRVWGAYPEGVSFAILIMNAFVPLMNTYIKPKRFGEEVKNG